MKYKLTDNKKEHFGTTLYQIEATISFGVVTKGELGGWIEKEANLAQDGNAWVSGNASVSGDASVSGNARVFGNAWVSGDASVSGNARVFGNAWVYGKFRLSLGYFFGTRDNNEEIKYVRVDNKTELICKGDIKVETQDTEAKTKKAAILAKIEELKKEAEALDA